MIKLLMALAWTALSASPVFAGHTEKDPLDQRTEIRLHVENDSIFGFKKDQNYTNGFRLDIQKRPDYSDEPLSASSHCQRRSWGLVLGQNMYTPLDIKDPMIRRFERPYAGWLYAGYFSQVEKIKLSADDVIVDYSLTKSGFLFGLIGPQALGFDKQSWWHRVVDAPAPRGWDNQVAQEFGLVYHYEWMPVHWERRWIPLEFAKINGGEASLGHFDIDLRPRVQVNLGNIYDNASFEATLRLGKLKTRQDSFRERFKTVDELGHMYSAKQAEGPLYAQAPSGTACDLRKDVPYEEEDDRHGFRGWMNYLRKEISLRSEHFVYFTAAARTVAYNATIQGGLIDRWVNQARSSPHTFASVNPLVLDGGFGICINWRNLSLESGYVYRSSEMTHEIWTPFSQQFMQSQLVVRL